MFLSTLAKSSDHLDKPRDPSGAGPAEVSTLMKGWGFKIKSFSVIVPHVCTPKSPGLTGKSQL